MAILCPALSSISGPKGVSHLTLHTPCNFPPCVCLQTSKPVNQHPPSTVRVFNTWKRTIKMGAHNCVPGFLNFGITNVSGCIIPCCGGHSVRGLQHWGEGEEQIFIFIRGRCCNCSYGLLRRCCFIPSVISL